MRIKVNGQWHDLSTYYRFHSERFNKTLAAVRRTGARHIVEIGGHPWAMTSLLLDDPRLHLLASVSAEEVTAWPDDIGISQREYIIETSMGNVHRLVNYSANIERTDLLISEAPDLVLACEIIEHLVRAPHRLLLNVNQWLRVGGYVLLTTPNGAQFQNLFRVKTRTPALRDSVYKRHNYLFEMSGLTDLLRSCGFEVVETDLWQVYPRNGISRLYDLVAELPIPYFKQKFRRTIYVLARKKENCFSAKYLPKIYEPGEMWERIEPDKRRR